MDRQFLIRLLSRLSACVLVLGILVFTLDIDNQGGLLSRVLVLAGLYGATTLGLWLFGMLARQDRSASVRLQFAWFAVDVVAAGALIYLTGGISSPFTMLLGLIVLLAGTTASLLLPILTSVLACMAYLAAVYSASVTGLVLEPAEALHALLQVSALLLVGGVMAYIARRHQGLRRTSDAMQRQHRRLKGLHSLIMEAMSEGVVVLDAEGQLYEMNAAARKLLANHDAADELLLAGLMQRLPALRQWMLSPERSGDFHQEIRHGGRVLLLGAKALRDVSSQGEPAWLLTLVDISDIRRLEGKLLEEEKMAALGRMSAMLAHEIRNPIQTMAQGLELMGLDISQRQTVQQILQDEMLRLNRLVNTMLDYSRPLQRAPGLVDMRPLLQSAISQADLKGESIRWVCEAESLWLDADHFRLVVDNLLSNALKNRRSGTEVELALEQLPGGWQLRVSNQGEIREQVREQLFQPFVSGSSQGIGLGLATVKQVCDLNGWDIDVEVGEGQVCFIVSGRVRSESDVAEEERRSMEKRYG